MDRQRTSTIIVYVRKGDTVTPQAVYRSWYRGAFVETSRCRVPWSQIRREPMYDVPVGPLGYGRAELVAGGFVKPSLYMFDALPCLHLHP